MNRKDTWWGLYVIGALALAMLVANALAPLTPTGHDLLTIGGILFSTGFVLMWTEQHADLVETDGADAWAADDQWQRGWFISDGLKTALPGPSTRSLQRSEQAVRSEPEYGILDRKEMQRQDDVQGLKDRVRTTA